MDFGRNWRKDCFLFATEAKTSTAVQWFYGQCSSVVGCDSVVTGGCCRRRLVSADPAWSATTGRLSGDVSQPVRETGRSKPCLDDEGRRTAAKTNSPCDRVVPLVFWQSKNVIVVIDLRLSGRRCRCCWRLLFCFRLGRLFLLCLRWFWRCSDVRVV